MINMAIDYRIVDYTVENCPKCPETHSYKLKVENTELVFGAGASQAIVEFTCPTTNQTFKETIPNPADGEIEGVATDAEIADFEKELTEKASPMEPAYAEMIKNSRSVAFDFCKTMISLSAGAIPVYFAVLKFLGFEKIAGIPLGQAAVLPAILYLAALMIYSLGLRPELRSIPDRDIPNYYRERLITLNKYITAGTLTFVATTVLAVGIFFFVMTS